MDDEYIHHSRGPERGKRGPTESQAAAARVRQAAEAAQGYVLKQLKEVDNTSSSSSSQGGLEGGKPQYPYDRPSLRKAPHPTPQSVQAGTPKTAAQSNGSVMDQFKHAAQDLQPPAMARAKAQREQEARWLREMFQAVWPDLGSFRSWTTATKVASMSGSLSLSLAFFGLVYYFSTKYDRAKQVQEPPQQRVE